MIKRNRPKLPFYVHQERKTAKPPPRQRLGYSIEEFAELTGVGRSSVYKALRNGCLTARKVGKRTIIAAEEVDKWFARLPFWTQIPPENRNPWG
jgi:excisionase family DNA binding protein